jgi:hypothetical protein
MLKRFWNWLLSKTTIDEKVVEVAGDVQEVVQETKRRARRVKQEAADVVEAVKEVAKQSKDVVDAANGGARKGRPKKKYYPPKKKTSEK